jgi:hypothetical protein
VDVVVGFVEEDERAICRVGGIRYAGVEVAIGPRTGALAGDDDECAERHASDAGGVTPHSWRHGLTER